eukprot:GILJ01006125.1.p1 GENE.GILJ01006125.1~~GILJ01006125.1.p1  ORF type:complete len:536 (-),score=54.65 GILJ01006125.1:270-1772(-)
MADNYCGLPMIVNLPLSASNRPTVVGPFFAHCVDSLSFIVDIFSAEAATLLGRVVVQGCELAALRGKLVRSVMGPSLTAVASFSCHFIIGTPFVHSANDISSLWSENPYERCDTVVIGHRGCGANQRGALLNENTILSFVQAGKHGVDFVEFDVFLTKDKVPVIYHDQTICVNPESDHHRFFAPIHSLSLKEFRELRGDFDKGHTHHEFNNIIKDRLNTFRKGAKPTPLRRTRSWDEKLGSVGSAVVDKVSDIDEVRIASATLGPAAWKIHDSFPTLEDTFREVPEDVGFNIEIKYPPDEVWQANTERSYWERNIIVDAILKVVFDHAKSRMVMFASFDPDICVLLSFKQARFPVFFLCWWPPVGTKDECVDSTDPRCTNPEAAINFAASLGLHGIVCEASWMLQNLSRVSDIKSRGLMLFTYGNENEDFEHIRQQKQHGVDGVICDNVAHVFKQKSTHAKIEGNFFASEAHLHEEQGYREAYRSWRMKAAVEKMADPQQ